MIAYPELAYFTAKQLKNSRAFVENNFRYFSHSKSIAKQMLKTSDYYVFCSAF